MFLDTQNDRAVLQRKNSRTKVREFLRGEADGCLFLLFIQQRADTGKDQRRHGQTTQEMSQRLVRKLTPR